jgi:hypothetical protein
MLCMLYTYIYFILEINTTNNINYFRMDKRHFISLIILGAAIFVLGFIFIAFWETTVSKQVYECNYEYTWHYAYKWVWENGQYVYRYKYVYEPENVCKYKTKNTTETSLGMIWLSIACWIVGGTLFIAGIASLYHYNRNRNTNVIPISPSYAPSAPVYVAPSQNYVVPAQNYVPPSQNYGVPSQNYVAPSQNYVAPLPTYMDVNHPQTKNTF